MEQFYLEKKGINNYYYRVLSKVMEHTDLDLNIPFDKNSEKDINVLLYGSDEIIIEEKDLVDLEKENINRLKE